MPVIEGELWFVIYADDPIWRNRNAASTTTPLKIFDFLHSKDRYTGHADADKGGEP